MRAKTNLAMDLAIEESTKKKERTLEEMIPQELRKYRSVFDKNAADRFPERRTWDHAIDLQPDFIPKRHTSTRCHYQNRTNSKNLSRKTSRRDTFDLQNRHKRRPSSLSRRRMGNYDQYKTIGCSTRKRSKMLIHSH
jgi:hypothetical protein